MKVRSRLRRLVRRVGYDVLPFQEVDCPNVRRRMLLDAYAIDMVLDVGANSGQYAQALRESGYEGHIMSFEPLPQAFEVLSRRATSDSNWVCKCVAVGEVDSETAINVSSNLAASSLLPTSERLTLAEPSTASVESTVVTLRRLDSLTSNLVPSFGRLWLKLDVQGYERQVLDGAPRTLESTHLVEAELSLTKLYEGQALYREIIDRLSSLGFELVGLDRGFTDVRTGQVLQVDGTFTRLNGSG